MNSRTQYEEKKLYYKKVTEEHTKSINLISNLRLLTFFVGFGTSVYLYIMKKVPVSIAVAVVALAIFIYLVFKHNKAIVNKKYSELLLDINIDSLGRLDGDWKSFKDSGEEFMEDNHRYTADLDVFGKGSLFQWMNSAGTFMGRIKLKEALSLPLGDITQINDRQSAVDELAKDLNWRQSFIAEGRIAADKSSNPQELLKWAEEIDEVYLNPWLKVLCRVLPGITLLIILLSFTTNILPHYWRSIMICLQIIMLVPGNGKRSSSLGTIYKYKDNIRIYEKMLSLIENKDFNSGHLKELKNRLWKGKESSLKQLEKLQNISEMISERKNFFYLILDILLLWDYQCMFRLEEWKRSSGKMLKLWLDVIGEYEMINSLANIRFDYEEWVFPVVSEGERLFEGESIGHPLIFKGRVHNDVSMNNKKRILLITGSNMSGKSTLLRTVGVNLVLAYAGAPVCAKGLKCSIMDIYTCMRIGDNLEKSISSFYAEILRIKLIVQAVKEGKQVFFLLDEIFKGTNSFDRHMGAKYLINMLRKEGDLGMVSTHDLELGEIEKDSNGEVKNYHFREYYENNELHFDYKLREGISTTRNALYLIRMAGIEVDEC